MNPSPCPCSICQGCQPAAGGGGCPCQTPPAPPSGCGCPPPPPPPPPAPCADLGISKCPESDSACPGSSLTYRIVITNYGPGDASNLYISDNLPPGLGNQQYMVDLSGQWQPWLGSIFIPRLSAQPGFNTATLQISTVIDQDFLGELINTATVSACNPDPCLDNNTATCVIQVVPCPVCPECPVCPDCPEPPPCPICPECPVCPECPSCPACPEVPSYTYFVSSKTAEPCLVNPGGILTYLLTIQNTGTAPSPDPLVITDQLPPYLSYRGGALSPLGAVTNLGTATYLNLAVAGALAPGQQTTVTIPVMVAENAPQGQLLPNMAILYPGGFAVIEETPPATVVIAPVLSVTKTPSVSEVTPNSTMVYTLVIQNTGGPTEEPFTITDTLPDYVSYGEGAASTTGLIADTSTARQVSLSILGSIPSGGSATVTIPVLISPAAPMGLLAANSALVIPGNGGQAVSGTETAPAMVVPPPLPTFPNLDVLKTSSPLIVVPGETVTYTITITNTGQVATSDPYTISDTLPPNVAYGGGAAISTGNLTLTKASPSLIFSVAGAIPAGGTATFTIPVTVDANAPYGSLAPNTVTVNPGNGGAAITAIETNPPLVNP